MDWRSILVCTVEVWLWLVSIVEIVCQGEVVNHVGLRSLSGEDPDRFDSSFDHVWRGFGHDRSSVSGSDLGVDW